MYEKLVDHKNYISAHRHRFDNGGIGRGIGPNMPTGAGRLGRMLEREFTLGMHQLTRPNYGGAAVLKDPNLTTDVIQSLAKRAPPVRFSFLLACARFCGSLRGQSFDSFLASVSGVHEAGPPR